MFMEMEYNEGWGLEKLGCGHRIRNRILCWGEGGGIERCFA